LLTQPAFRQAEEQDAETIRALVRQARLNPFGLDWRRFWVADADDGQIVGCIQAKPHKGGGLELASLVVSRDWRRQGLGGALVTGLMERNGPPLWLMCQATLAPYYRQFAFQQVVDAKEMPPYFRRIQRLFNLVRPFTPGDARLAIMVWRG